jgi:hypothetical protein
MKHNVNANVKSVADMESVFFRNMSEISSYSAESVKPMRPFNNLQAYNALLKGYCSINILTIPKAFGDAGWVVGILSIIFSGIISMLCAN